MMTGKRQLHDWSPFLAYLHSHYLLPAAFALRSFDGASPSASRYFATVRRATAMPSPESSSAIRLSDSGLPESSSLMSLRILARTAVDEAPPPSAASTWLEKKYLSSNTPRGVCMYLLEVTREMVDSCMSMAWAMSLRIIGRMLSSPCSRNAVCRSTMDRATFI